MLKVRSRVTTRRGRDWKCDLVAVDGTIRDEASGEEVKQFGKLTFVDCEPDPKALTNFSKSIPVESGSCCMHPLTSLL